MFRERANRYLYLRSRTSKVGMLHWIWWLLTLALQGRLHRALQPKLYAARNLCMHDFLKLHHNWDAYIGVEKERKSTFLTAFEQQEKEARSLFAAQYWYRSCLFLSWAPNYISPRWINISLLTITSKTCEALSRHQSYRFIVKWIALLNLLDWAAKSTAVESWFNFERMSRRWNQISLICVRRQQKLFCFFQLHCLPLWSCFSTLTIFKTKHGHQLQPDDHKPLFRQTCETNSETRFSLKSVNVGDEQKFPKTNICIILVDLSAKIYTSPKIVRGLKRLRTTELTWKALHAKRDKHHFYFWNLSKY